MKCVNPQPCPLPLLVPRLGVSVLPYPSQPNPAPKLPTRRPRLPPGQKIATAQIVGSLSRRAPQQKVSQKLPVTTNFWPFSVKFTLAHKAVNAVEQSRSKKSVFVWKFFRHVIDDCSNCSFHFTNQPIVTFETQLKLSILHWSTSRTIIDQWSVVMHSQQSAAYSPHWEISNLLFWRWWWAYRWCRVKQRFRESSASSTIGIGLRCGAGAASHNFYKFGSVLPRVNSSFVRF